MEKQKYRVLLVEDDKLDQIAFKRLLEQEALPYDCKMAECVSAARDILATEKFDIVITDYNLPDGTGLEVLDMVTDAPVILITGTGDEEIAIRAWKAGAYDYLIKDVKRNYLKAVPITVENARPCPILLPSSLVLKNGSNILSAISSGIPTPVSVMRICTHLAC